MIFSGLCPPALIYLIYSVVQIGIDIIKGFYNTAFVKVWVAFIFTILLNYLCQSGLGIVSWVIIFIPFVLMTTIVAVLLFQFGLDSKTGKLRVYSKSNSTPLNSNKEKREENTYSSVSYGVDENTNNNNNTNTTEQFNIQKKSGYGKNVNIDYKNESVVKKYNKERRDLVNIIRGILIDMGEPDKAAYFMNSAELCINSIQEEEFKNCLLNKCDEIGNTLNINKNKIFKQKVKEFL